MKNYEIFKWPSKTDSIVRGKFGEVNRTKLTDARASQLLNAGFPYIKKIVKQRERQPKIDAE